MHTIQARRPSITATTRINRKPPSTISVSCFPDFLFLINASGQYLITVLNCSVDSRESCIDSNSDHREEIDKRIFQSPQSTAAWPPYGSIPMGRPPLGSGSGVKRQQAVDAFAMQQGRDQGQQPYPIQPLPARAYSFDKAKSSESQPYFANGHQHDPKLYPEDSDNKSNKSRGNVSSFSEGVIYATCGQA